MSIFVGQWRGTRLNLCEGALRWIARANWFLDGDVEFKFPWQDERPAEEHFKKVTATGSIPPVESRELSDVTDGCEHPRYSSNELTAIAGFKAINGPH